jgi:short-subunit dehydrogenase
VPIALITGATAGLGAEFARQLAGAGHDLVLVARDSARLAGAADELGGRYSVRVDTISADLAGMAGLSEVETRLAATERPVDLLVNNAGIGLRNAFHRNSIDDEERLLNLNVRAVMRLTHAVLPPMMERRRGAVLNVSSLASFGPTAAGSSYPASKAWVTAFSESLWLSMRRHRIRVMALCPGFVRTEFHQRAGIGTDGIDDRLWLEADNVVRTGLADLRRGKAVSVPDLRYKVAGGLLRHTPRPVLLRVIGRTGRQLGRGVD